MAGDFGDGIAFALVSSIAVPSTCSNPCTGSQDLKDHMRGAGGQVEYVKIMQDFDGRSKVVYTPKHTNTPTLLCVDQPDKRRIDAAGIWRL